MREFTFTFLVRRNGVTLIESQVENLKNTYPEVSWRQNFLNLCHLAAMLQDSIIGDNYVISDAINNAIHLTPSATDLIMKLGKRVPLKEARLMCFLAIGGSKLFIDVDKMDHEKVREAISESVQKDQIRFPFIAGRELYDSYASIFEEEKQELSVDDTQKLLDTLPIGVYQYGELTVGPLGVHRSLSRRFISAKRSVPAYHCSKRTCTRVHKAFLTTSHTATINQKRPIFEETLRNEHPKPEPWWQFAAELNNSKSAYYNDQDAAPLFSLIGDCLSNTELQTLVIELLDNSKGETRKALSSFCEVADARTYVANSSRAELLQVVLVASERTIQTALDSLVKSAAIKIPKGEIRKAVLSSNVRSGAFRLRAELGHYGVRYASDDPGLAILKHKRLISELYLGGGDESDTLELEWQLRGFNIVDLNERLEHFLQTQSPFQAISRLVLARRSNVIIACERVGLGDYAGFTDEELIEAIMWKLGFELTPSSDPHQEFWSLLQKLSALTQSTEIGNSVRFTEVAATFFVALEGILQDSLAFTSWALTEDHVQHSEPFSYDDLEDRSRGNESLETAANKLGDDHSMKFSYSTNRVELQGLIGGFRTLSKHLRCLLQERDTHQRPEADFPDYVSNTDLKKFLLRSTIPFLNLSPPSQERILAGLDEISSVMTQASVSSVRNGYTHYRRVPPDITKVEIALEAIHKAISTIEKLGFARLLFRPSTITVNEWGLRHHAFEGPRSFEHSIVRPSTLDWMMLPSLSSPQYLMSSASFDDPNEVLRFTPRFHSPYADLWRGYPNWRKYSSSSDSTDQDFSEPVSSSIEGN